MAFHFLDTSALVRRYVPTEAGSDVVRSLCNDAGNTVLIADIAGVEVASSLARRTREGSVDRTMAAHIWDSFDRDRALQYHVVPISRTVLAEAERLPFRQNVRAHDAIQVAAAHAAADRLKLSGVHLRFVTADRRQAEAAGAERLNVDLIE